MNIYPIVLYPNWLIRSRAEAKDVKLEVVTERNDAAQVKQKINRKFARFDPTFNLVVVAFASSVSSILLWKSLFTKHGLTLAILTFFGICIGANLIRFLTKSNLGTVTRSKSRGSNRVLISQKTQTKIPSVLEPKGSSTATIGVSEKFFLKYLELYFPGWVREGESFAVPGKEYEYSSDFSLVLPNGVRVQLEIDEPYVLRTGEPHHCGDNTKDSARDRFFLDGHWIIIRFAEIQIVESPEGCCRKIAEELSKLGIRVDKFDQLSTYDLPKIVRSWRESEAKQMAKIGFRTNYLVKAGLIKLNPSAIPSRKVKKK
jgi:hypothetical protein